MVGSGSSRVSKNSGMNERRIKLEAYFSKFFYSAFPPVFPSPEDHVPEVLLYVYMYGYVCIKHIKLQIVRPCPASDYKLLTSPQYADLCMYILIKLHITTQSDPVILVILCNLQ